MSLSKSHHPDICNVCHHYVKSGIFCDLCEHWIHPSCNHLSKYEFQLLRTSNPKNHGTVSLVLPKFYHL